MRDSLAHRLEIFLATALVASHASFDPQGFRVRDVIFFVELFINWIESAFEGNSASPQTIQISRYIDNLVIEGLAKRLSKKQYPTFRLTRAGLIELLNRIAFRTYTAQREHFFFVFCFIVGYKQRLINLASREGKTFPPALQLELADILDTQQLLTRELKAVELELQKLTTRIEAGQAGSALAEDMLKSKHSLQDTIATIQKEFPYELNSTKPLSELMDSIQKDQRAWELVQGPRYRSTLIWHPCQALLLSYKQQLIYLKKYA